MAANDAEHTHAEAATRSTVELLGFFAHELGAFAHALESAVHQFSETGCGSLREP